MCIKENYFIIYISRTPINYKKDFVSQMNAGCVFFVDFTDWQTEFLPYVAYFTGAIFSQQ